MSFLRFIGSVWPMLLVAGIAGNIGFVVAARVMGLKLKEIRLFGGNPIWSMETSLGKLCIGYLPIGGSVSFDDETYEKMPITSQFVVALGGTVAVLAISLVSLGWAPAVHAFVSGFGHVLFFLKSPSFSPDGGVVLLKSFQAMADASWPTGLGVLAAKMAAFAWLPTAGGHTGQMLCLFAKRYEGGKLAPRLEPVMVGLQFLIIGFWLVALVKFVLQ